MKPVVLVGKELADDLLDKLLVNGGIEIGVLPPHSERSRLDDQPACAVLVDELVLVETQAALFVPHRRLAAGRDGVLRYRVPELDGVGKLARIAEEIGKKVVLPALWDHRWRLALTDCSVHT